MNQNEQIPSGVLLVDKDQDMTSHDVVAIARRSLGIKKSAIAELSIQWRPGFSC